MNLIIKYKILYLNFIYTGEKNNNKAQNKIHRILYMIKTEGQEKVHKRGILNRCFMTFFDDFSMARLRLLKR